MRVAPQILLSDAERAELHAAAANLRRGLRARIILLAAEGLQNKAIATHLGIGRVQVARWRDRYAQSRLAGIEHDLPRGAPPVRVDVERLVELAGAPAMERVSTRSLASALGVSASSVSRHWRAKGLPGRHGAPASQSLDLGGRPVEVVGLYVAPREHALAVACRAGGTDEGQPARPNTAMQRHLATSFMTALQLLDADAAALPAASMLHPAFPQSAGWLGFMRELEAKTPDDMTLHLVADNHVAQQHPEVRAWIISHPRIVVHLLAGAPAWRRAVQQVLREAAGGLPAGIPQVLAFMSEPVHWPLRWERQDSGEPSRSVSPRDASRGDTQMGPLPPEPAHIEPVPGFAPQLHAVALTGQAPNLEPDCGAAEPVASAKLLPPRQGRQLIAREALMARLQDARRRRCVVVQGQAGSGKTSTLATWRKTLISLGFDVCWLALGSEDNDPARFFECLAASLDGIDPGLARGAAVPGGDYDAAAIEHWVITLVQALGQRQRDLVVIVDDLHHITSPSIIQALQWLIDYAPPQLHLAFASRSALLLALERLRAQGMVAEFDMRDLCFTAAESERFLRQQLGTIDPRDAAAIHALTDGWVAGLQLFAVDLRARRGAGYPGVPVRDARSFVSYFEREVVVRLAPDDLDMLVRMAICPSFCVALCASVLGKPEAEIGARLARLEADNLFLAQMGSAEREPWYRIHPLLRETLLERLGQLPESERQALHAVAWRWFDARGRLDDAVLHAVRSGDEAAAAAMVEACGQALLARGELSQLSALLRLLPPGQVRQRHGLLVVKCYVQLYARDVDGLQHTLEDLAVHDDAADPARGYTRCLLRAGLALQLDDADTVLAMLPQLWDIPPGADDLAWSSRGNVLSWLFLQRGEYDEVRRLQDDATMRTGAPRSSLFGRYIRATSLALEGHVERAGQHVREVLREAERQGPAYVGLACLAAGLLADMLYEANDPEGACRLLEPRIAVLERVSLPDVVLRALTVLSNAHWLAGRRTPAMACLDRLEAYAVRFGLDRVLAEALVLRLRRHLQLAETERANTVLGCVVALAEKHPGGTRGERIRRVAALGRIEMAVFTQDYAAAARMIDALTVSAVGLAGKVGVTGAAGTEPGAASLQLQRAMVQQALHNEAVALDAFGRALRMGHGASLVRSLLDVTTSAPDAFIALALAPLHEPVLAFYVKRLLAALRSSPSGAPTHLASGPSATTLLSERESEILGLLAQAMSNKKIASVLNLSPETVKWHLKNIYAKLGVNGRGRAAARLRDLAASVVTQAA